MSRTLAAFVGAVAMLLGGPASGQQEEALPTPFFQPVSGFGWRTGNDLPTQAVLTAAEEAALLQAIAGLELFPAYLYSGCHDRAHAAFMLMPAALQSKLMKIWLVGPARYTAGFRTPVRLKGDDAALRDVEWGYHVAIAWKGPNGLRVFDPALRPREALTREGWFGLMEIPRLSFWTLTRGNLYQFNYSKLDPGVEKTTLVWNGNTFDYVGKSLEEEWIPRNLARDSVGVLATKKRSCSAFNDLATSPEKLYDKLFLTGADRVAGCEADYRLYDAERQKWSARLKG